MFANILVVCDGNICRSPTAAAMLSGKLNRVVESAGFIGLEGREMDQTARSVAAEHGLDCPPHRARKLTRDICARADLILVMENRHREQMRQLAPEASGKTFLLGEWLGKKEIPDPFKRDRDTYEFVYRLMHQAVDEWLTRL